MVFDKLDYEILYELDINSKQGYSSISKKVGRSKQVISYRINSLRGQEIILGPTRDVNIRAMGYMVFNVFLQFKNLEDKKEKELYKHLQNSKEIGYLISTMGNWDIFFSVSTKSPLEFSNFLKSFLNKYGKYVNKQSINLELKSSKFDLKFLLEKI